MIYRGPKYENRKGLLTAIRPHYLLSLNFIIIPINLNMISLRPPPLRSLRFRF